MTQAFYYDVHLPFVEARRAVKSRACYVPHTHPTLSIGVVDEGYSKLIIEHDAPMHLQAGDLVIIPEHCVHSCNPEAGSAWSYQMLYIDVAWFRAWQAKTKNVPEASFMQTCHSAHHRDASLYECFSQLNALLFTKAGQEAKEETLISFLSAFLFKAPPLPKTPPTWVSLLQEKFTHQAEENWSLLTLAEEYQLSRYHLIRSFRAHTGLSPHAYLLDRRIQLAKARLKEGAVLADLAHELGFSDQSHFQKVFRQRVSASPGDYRKQMV